LAARRKAEQEIEEYRKWQQLSRDSVEVNSTLRRLRPTTEREATLQEKNDRSDPAGSCPRSRTSACAPAPQTSSTRQLDLEAVEMANRSALQPAGAAALTELTLLTAVGSAELLRPYFLCAHCHHGQFLPDVELDVEDTELSPGVSRMLAVVGSDAAFATGANR
jgi:hypothetical protein